MRRLSLLVLCTVICMAASPAAQAQTQKQAQEQKPVFPNGLHLGLVPPPGMTASQAFPGFEDRERKAGILINDLPGPAYEGFLQSMNRGALDVPGVSNTRREILITNGGAAHLVTGDQEADGVKFKKWLLITRQTVASEKTDLTMSFVVTAQVPQDALAIYPDAAIRKALQSVTLRPTIPNEEILATMPFRLEDLGGFSAARVIVPGRAVLLSEGPVGQTEPVDQPFMMVSIAPSETVPADERRRFSEQLLQGIQGYRDMKITFAEPLRLDNRPVFEIRLEGKYESTGGDVVLVQWIRFAPRGFVRIVGVAPKAAWSSAFPRFRAVRDGLENR
jgi:hypothetical protein